MDSFPLLFRMGLALAIVLGLIFGAVWLVRRVGPVRLLAGRRPGMDFEVVGQTHLAPRRSIYAVRVNGRTLLLGVTQSQVNFLTELDTPEEPADDRPTGRTVAPSRPAGAQGGFSQELARVFSGMDQSRARLAGDGGEG